MALCRIGLKSLAAFLTLTTLSVPALAQPKKDAAPAKKAPPTTTPAPASTTPAPAATTPAPEAKTEEEPKEEEGKEDVNAVYISGDLAFTRADVGGFSDTLGFDKTAANGLLAGFGIGYRRGPFRIGARFRDLDTVQYSLWGIMGELGYGLKMRPLSPTFHVHLGYLFDTGVERGAFEKKLPAGNFLTPNIDLRGVIVGGEVVASYWLTRNLRVGPFIGFDLTVLHRPQPNLPQSLFQLNPDIKTNPLFSDSGDGLGYVFSIGIRLTADIGLDAAIRGDANKDKDEKPAATPAPATPAPATPAPASSTTPSTTPAPATPVPATTGK